MDADYVDFHWQIFMQNGIYKNHLFNYEDTHAKHRTWRDDISTGLAPLRCVHGSRTWHKTDKSTIDPAKRQGLGPRISYKVTFILHKHLLKKKHETCTLQLLFLGTSGHYQCCHTWK